MRNLLQGSANLEFWECYLLPEIWADLQRADQVIARINSHNQETAVEPTVEEVATDSLQSDSTATDLEALADLTASADNAQASNSKATESLFSLLEPNQLYNTPVVGMAHVSDIERIDSLLNLPQVKRYSLATYNLSGL